MIDRRAEDTIVAVSTPPGRGGVGMVRLSGPRAHRIARAMFRAAGGGAARAGSGAAARDEADSGVPGRVRFGRFLDGDGRAVDDGYLLLLDPPRTYTREPIAELWAHGSPVVLRLLVSGAVGRGARPADPGEFTLRALLSGRIDATQAEAVRDLVEAQTAHQARLAHEQMGGRISRAVDALKDRLAGLIARVEAAIEFPGEDEEALSAAGLAPGAGLIRRDLEDLAGTFERGRRIRDGLRAAIVGLPNAGKSSLFNRLLEEERAIVTPFAGTTRDLLEETVDLGGVPLTLVDSAGLHEAGDAAGAEGVRRARDLLATADLLVVVLDGSRALRPEERELLRDRRAARGVIVLNKVDLPGALSPGEILYLRREHGALEVSAKTGEGIADLRRRLAATACEGAPPPADTPFITSLRQRDLLARAAAALARAEKAAGDGVGEECIVLDLRAALDRLGEITGEVGIESIHERIFSTFCIGK